MSQATVRGRVRRIAAAVAIAAAATGGSTAAVKAQDGAGWRFGTEPFAELWYHGLAMVGLESFGRIPLYDAGYTWAVVSERRATGVEPTPLERDRGELHAALSRDPAFEVLHFVPLYFTEAPIEVALDALEALDNPSDRRTGSRIRREAAALARVLHEPEQRRTVARFVQALRAERSHLPARDRGELESSTREIRALWVDSVRESLGHFLEREGFSEGQVVLTPALGPEGRVLERDGRPIVVVGASAETEPGAVVGAVVRELCFPAVRRALEPYEAWFDDRGTVSDVSDQAATRCGALLLEAHAPELMASYQDRFGDTASDAAFLSAAGFTPGVAALERPLNLALRRELELELDSGSHRAMSGPARR
jgi:hypothetical protein